jgi:hypothetical protein
MGYRRQCAVSGREKLIVDGGRWPYPVGGAYSIAMITDGYRTNLTGVRILTAVMGLTEIASIDALRAADT